MLTTDRSESICVPLWLIIATVLALVIRIGFNIWEAGQKSMPNKTIAWQSNADAALALQKPILYYFSADWSQRCLEFERDCFGNGPLVDLINEKVIPVHVVDKSVENGANPPDVQNLENKYGAHAFPCVVLALPDGTASATTTGAKNYRELKRWMLDELTQSKFVAGSEDFARGDFDKAVAALREFLDEKDTNPIQARIARLRYYVSLRCLHRDREAKEALEEALSHEHDRLQCPYHMANAVFNGWPYPLLKHFAGKLDYEQLDKRQEYDNASYTALLDWSKQDYQACAAHLERALETCPSKSYWSYRAARSLIMKLPPEYRDPLEKKYFF
ncbi:MAG: thioredoxin family protein [Candidatus Melainabacteria bacterium]|nr:thioredoxin family protein [Candidatus Melainabacteria bacterium]